MAETLFIRLGSRYQDKIHWLITAPDHQEIIASGELNNAQLLTELTEKAQTRKVVTFVPASDIAFRAVMLPAKSLRAKKQIVPYMLEEELAQPVDDLFFAYGNINATEQANCYAAAVELAQIEQWLAWLNAVDITSTKMIPDALAMPLFSASEDESAQHLSSITLDEQMVVRQGEWQAMLVEQDIWQLYQQNLTQTTVVHHFSPRVESDNEQLTYVAEAEELPLFLLAKHVDNAPINLLQGQFLQKNKTNQLWQIWRLAASLVAIALVMSLISKGVQYSQLDEQQNLVEQQVESLYQEYFAAQSNKKVSVNRIRTLIRSKMKGLDGAQNTDSFFTLFEKMTPAFQQVNSFKPDTLKFDSKRKELRIQATAASYQDFNRFKTELEKVRLVVTQGAQNNQGDSISGSLSIKDAS